ncbi:hypothetical protein C9374_000355 [Naegleria lovaniensis]|uniref:Uncharacterized protein n=1 Tax=Naegleria lovaniensis TaxID=51637 RepID=A0AA88KPS5_NAELO|nr:uncharacterized protein C9374_000355 [Naegleria lovaniensis]KAG2388916.1 hypothetical protein C9374_000355 [Naegleria lovaniensis]
MSSSSVGTSSSNSNKPLDERIKFFKHIPIIKFENIPLNYLNRDDVCSFLGDVIPGLDLEILFKEFRVIMPHKNTRRRVDTLIYDRQNNEEFNHVKTKLLQFQNSYKYCPRSVLDKTTQSERLCFMKAEYVHEMFVYALTEDDSDLVSSFSLLRSILDETILKSPYPSSFKQTISVDKKPTSGNKKKNKDKVFPIVFQPAKHEVWEISLSESWVPMVKEEKNVATKGLKQLIQEDTGSSTSSSPLAVSSDTSKSLVTSSDSNLTSRSATQSAPNTNQDINNEMHTSLWPQDYTLTGIVSFGKAIRQFSNFSIQKTEVTFLISKQNITDQTEKMTTGNSKKVTLKRQRISQAWLLHDEGAFGFSYDGGVSGIVSSIFFDSSFSFITINASPIQKPVVELFQTALQLAPYDKKLIKKGVLTPQQLKELISSHPKTDTSTNGSTDNTIRHPSNCDKDNTSTASTGTTRSKTTHDTASSQIPKTKSVTNSNETLSCKLDSKNDMSEDQNSHTSACYDDYDQALPSSEPNVKKRKLENETVINPAQQPIAVENEKLLVLQRLHEYQILSSEEYRQKVTLIDAVNRYKNGDTSLMKEIIEKKKVFLTDFSSFPQFICPLTGTLAKEPVLGNDGQIYEKEAIMALLYKNATQSQPMKVTQYSIIQSAAQEVNQIIESKLQDVFEFLHNIIAEFSIFDIDLLPLLTAFMLLDTHRKYTLKSLYLKFKIIEANISRFRSNELASLNASESNTEACSSLLILQDCITGIISLETEKRNMIPALIFGLKEKVSKDVFNCYSLALYVACESKFEELYDQLAKQKSEFLYNSILCAVYSVVKCMSFADFIKHIKPEPGTSKATHYAHLLLLLCDSELRFLEENVATNK